LTRDLVQIGPDSIPQICEELDRTNEPRMIRRLGFVLRAIGDARAVPALIRSIPKCLQPASSDYGLLVGDKELLKFMQQHDLDRKNGGRNFGFGRPVREIFGALHRLTDQYFQDKTIYSVSRSGDENSAKLQRRLYDQQARVWRDWWEQNWQKYCDDASYQHVNLTLDKPDSDAVSIYDFLTENAKTHGTKTGIVISPAGESGAQFFDLDIWIPDWHPVGRNAFPRKNPQPKMI